MENMKQLAAAVGCGKYPERWDDIFPDVLREYREKGCEYIRPEYYADLSRKYGILEKHLPLYQEAAEAVGRDEALTLFLFVMCRGLSQTEYHEADIAAFSQPTKENTLGYRMLQALALASLADQCYDLLVARGLPEEKIRGVMRLPEGGISYYANRHDGEKGYDLLDWYQLATDGKLFPVGRLEYELFTTFHGYAKVFENQGKTITLSTDGLQEKQDCWLGYPLDPNGAAGDEQVSLPKAEWICKLAPGDPVVGVHIPPGGGLTPEIVDESLQEAKLFIRTYFPDYQYKAFTCHSWLMDPQLQAILGQDTNIVKFQKRFAITPAESSGRGALNFVFYKPDPNVDLTALPENTSLERSIKGHYLSGKSLCELIGYFF